MGTGIELVIQSYSVSKVEFPKFLRVKWFSFLMLHTNTFPASKQYKVYENSSLNCDS